MKSHEADIKRGEGVPMKGMKSPAKSMGNHQATPESAGHECECAEPNMGSRPMSEVPETSGVGYPMRSTPKPEKVREVTHNQSVLAKARKLNERSEMGGAEESAYPGK